MNHLIKQNRTKDVNEYCPFKYGKYGKLLFLTNFILIDMWLRKLKASHLSIINSSKINMVVYNPYSLNCSFTKVFIDKKLITIAPVHISSSMDVFAAELLKCIEFSSSES